MESNVSVTVTGRLSTVMLTCKWWIDDAGRESWERRIWWQDSRPAGTAKEEVSAGFVAFLLKSRHIADYAELFANCKPRAGSGAVSK